LHATREIVRFALWRVTQEDHSGDLLATERLSRPTPNAFRVAPLRLSRGIKVSPQQGGEGVCGCGLRAAGCAGVAPFSKNDTAISPQAAQFNLFN
jgi:hypothetical protein